MLNAVNTFFTALLGTVLPAWLDSPAVQYLISLAVVAVVFRILASFLRR